MSDNHRDPQDEVTTQLHWLEVVTDVSIEVDPDTGRAQLMLFKTPIKATVIVGGAIETEDEDEE